MRDERRTYPIAFERGRRLTRVLPVVPLDQRRSDDLVGLRVDDGDVGDSGVSLREMNLESRGVEREQERRRGKRTDVDDEDVDGNDSSGGVVIGVGNVVLVLETCERAEGGSDASSLRRRSGRTRAESPGGGDR